MKPPFKMEPKQLAAWKKLKPKGQKKLVEIYTVLAAITGAGHQVEGVIHHPGGATFFKAKRKAVKR